MSHATDTAAVVVSVGALIVSGLSLTVSFKSEKRQKKQAELAAEVTHGQQLQEVWLTVISLVTMWHNSNISHQFAVTDDNWAKLLERVKHWRTNLHESQTKLVAHTREGQTRAYQLLDETVAACREFESVVEPIVDDWASHTQFQDPFDDRQQVQMAVVTLQRKFAPVIEELESIRGEELDQADHPWQERRSGANGTKVRQRQVNLRRTALAGRLRPDEAGQADQIEAYAHTWLQRRPRSACRRMCVDWPIHAGASGDATHDPPRLRNCGPVVVGRPQTRRSRPDWERPLVAARGGWSRRPDGQMKGRPRKPGSGPVVNLYRWTVAARSVQICAPGRAVGSARLFSSVRAS